MVKEINFEILDSAAQQIKEIIKNEKSDTYLRIEILGGGCAGFSYKIDLDNNINDLEYLMSKLMLLPMNFLKQQGIMTHNMQASDVNIMTVHQLNEKYQQ